MSSGAGHRVTGFLGLVTARVTLGHTCYVESLRRAPGGGAYGEAGGWCSNTSHGPWCLACRVPAHLAGGHTETVGETPGEVLLPDRSSCPALAWVFSLGLRGGSARSHSQSKLSVDWSSGRSLQSGWAGTSWSERGG